MKHFYKCNVSPYELSVLRSFSYILLIDESLFLPQMYRLFPHHLPISLQDLVEDASRHETAVGVHCLAGLGRAPVLVVIALIESGNMKNVEAIELVRSKRRGTLALRQDG